MRKFNVLVSVPDEGSFNLTDVIFEMITPVETEPDNPEPVEVCGRKNPTKIFSDCVCVRPEGHEGDHGCTPDRTICEWANETEPENPIPLKPATEGLTVGELVRQLAQYDPNREVRLSLWNADYSTDSTPIAKQVDTTSKFGYVYIRDWEI